MSARDMPLSMLVRKAEGMGYHWNGGEFEHDQLRLRLAPVSKRQFCGGGAGMDCRATLAKLVNVYNAKRQELAA